jgi:hypothetical protein
MTALRVVVELNDNNIWALRPFIYLFQLNWSELQPVVVCGYNRPEYALPPNFEFYSISNVNYPAERWSDGFIQFLKDQDDKHFVFLLVDYWLSRTVDVRGVGTVADYIQFKDNVLRMDLTADRLYAGGMFDVEAYGCYDIIETPKDTPYQFSTQAGIWNRELMLSLLEPNKSPWDVEVQTQVPETMRVLGTRQYLVRYANAMLKGKLDMSQINMIPEDHRRYVMSMIPAEVLEKSSV